MKKILIILILFIPVMFIGQTTTENYIKSTVYQIETVDGNVQEDDKIETINYLDGLGRPKQNIAIRAGGDREDLITPRIYDALGRQPKDYLPLPEVSNNGNYYENPLTPLFEYYYNGYENAKHNFDINPYSEKRFENSPLNRVLEIGAPGKDWEIIPNSDSDHTIKFEYQTNLAWEVRLFTVGFEDGDTQDPILQYSNDEKYPANSLYKTVTKDENWRSDNDNEHENTTEEFKNKLGQVLLKRTFDAGSWENVDTNYIYDDFGNLTFVLSPKSEGELISSGELVTNSQQVLDDLCYQYNYDYRNRLIEKKIPGKGWEYILYDLLDRPVLTQDKNLRINDQWLFTKYDAYNRVAYTGIYTSQSNKGVLEQTLKTAGPLIFLNETQGGSTDINGTNVYYTNDAFPNQDLEVLTVNYYDNYVDLDGMTVPGTVFGPSTVSDPKGLPTVSKIRVLGTDDWITSFTAYDDKARVLYTRSKNNYLDTQDFTANILDFTGKVIESLTHHGKSGFQNILTMDYFTYDHMGRLLTHKQKIHNEEAQLIASNNYDDLGQLKSKIVGGIATLDGYTNLINVDVSSDGTITYIDHQDDPLTWPSLVKTKGEIPSLYDGGIKLNVSQNDKFIRLGLIESQNSSQDNNYFDYGIELTDTGVVKIVLEGIIATTPSQNVTYSSGDLFKVIREVDTINNNATIYFYKGSFEFHSLNTTEIDESLIGKVTFNGSPEASVTNLDLFGPYINKTLQTINYKYNIRGWLTDINNIEDGISKKINNYSDLFNFRINYNKVESNGITNPTPLYNGNIAQTFWKTKNEDENLRGYNYIYDDLNRIMEAKSYIGDDLLTIGIGIHDLTNIDYDLNGNIITLKREGSSEDGLTNGIWDDLTYTYNNGNQLSKVSDGSTNLNNLGFKDGGITGVDYTYDGNGNMLSDTNKHINTSDPIEYNHLNLPTFIKIDNYGVGGEISYVYDATGVKQEKIFVWLGIIADSTTTQYAGNYTYQTTETDELKLQFINHPEGYLSPLEESTDIVIGFKTDPGGGTGTITYSNYSYVFQYKDHLGNIRLSYSDNDLNGSIDPTSEIIEESNYYPFGLKQKGYNNVIAGGNDLAQNWKFGGKELNQELGLEWYDFTARNYDPAIGRWMNIDPLAEDMRRHSPYNYAFNNPIFFIDYDGMSPTPPDIYVNENGDFLGSDGADTKDVRVVSQETWDANGGQEGALTEEGTNTLQKSENSTLLSGTSEEQPGYQKPITISGSTEDQIVAAGGEAPQAKLENTTTDSVFIQPEATVTEGPGKINQTDIVEVKPGEAIYGGIDGVKTQAHKKDEITKVPTGKSVKLDAKGNTDIVNFLESATFGYYGKRKTNSYFQKLSESIKKN